MNHEVASPGGDVVSVDTCGRDEVIVAVAPADGIAADVVLSAWSACMLADAFEDSACTYSFECVDPRDVLAVDATAGDEVTVRITLADGTVATAVIDAEQAAELACHLGDWLGAA